MNKYAKAIVAALAAVGIGLETRFPGSQWSAFATAVAGAYLTYLVPNTTKTSVIPPDVVVSPKVKE